MNQILVVEDELYLCRVTEDMGIPSGGDGILTPMKSLMGNTGNVVFSPISLFLLGRASPFLHNGVMIQENQQGNVSRSENSHIVVLILN